MCTLSPTELVASLDAGRFDELRGTRACPRLLLRRRAYGSKGGRRASLLQNAWSVAVAGGGVIVVGASAKRGLPTRGDVTKIRPVAFKAIDPETWVALIAEMLDVDVHEVELRRHAGPGHEDKGVLTISVPEAPSATPGSGPAQGERRLGSIVVANAALVSSLVAFAYVALRLIRIAGGDTETALALLGHVALPDALLSLIVGQPLPVSFLIASSALVAWMSRLERQQRPLRTSVIILVGSSLLLILVAPPRWASLIVKILLVAVLVVLFAWLVVGSEEASFSRGMFSQLDRPRRLVSAEVRSRRLWEVISLAVSLLLVVAAGFNSDYWAAREVVVLSDRARLTGWILGEEGDWTSILRDQPREVVRVKTDQLMERRTCRARTAGPPADGSRREECGK